VRVASNLTPTVGICHGRGAIWLSGLNPEGEELLLMDFKVGCSFVLDSCVL
jgi:hypothetical protein